MPLFRRDKQDKYKDTAPTNVPPPADSGYATSENPSSEVSATTPKSRDHGMTNNTSRYDSGTNSNLSNRSRPANLQVDQPTGNVIDRDTGNAVVTVTTTTTTTTTTATNKDGRIEVKTEPANQEVQHRYDELQNNPSRSSNLSNMTNNSNRTGNVTDSSNPSRASNYADTTTNNPNHGVADTSSDRQDPNLTSATLNPSHESASFATTDPCAPGNFGQGGSPAIPAKSAMREASRNRVKNEDVPTSATGFSPTSPTRHNFSYPQRAPPNSMNSYQAANEKIPVENDPVRTTDQAGGTLANLKTAAAGLHVRFKIPDPHLLQKTGLISGRASAKPSAELLIPPWTVDSATRLLKPSPKTSRL
jgi:hypothetical protein